MTIGLWLINKGWLFEPNESQNQEFLKIAKLSVLRALSQADAVQQYAFIGIAAVFSFRKGNSKLQLVTAKLNRSSLEIILGFHSSKYSCALDPSKHLSCAPAACVMNIIAFDKVYALYPRATFEERVSLIMLDAHNYDGDALDKYRRHGWGTIPRIWPGHPELDRCFALGHCHSIGDKHTWVVPLDMDGVTLQPCLSPLSPEFQWDPFKHSTWKLDFQNQAHVSAFLEPLLGLNLFAMSISSLTTASTKSW